MKILIVEDDPSIRDSLKKSFEAECFAADTVSCGEKASFLARTGEYDLIILDNMLPKKDGRTVCQEIRKSGKKTPIIILSVKSDVNKKIEMLNYGADDYVTKPFSFEELLARVHAILRRPEHTYASVLSIEDLELDTVKHTVRRGKKLIYLTRKEFSLLEYLLRNKNIVVSRSMIMEHVWDSDSDPFSNTIEAHVLNLRKKVDADFSQKLIHNIPGRGYKIDIHR